MKKIYLTILMASIILQNLSGQSFTDNFDTYTAGAYLGTSSSIWKTWGNHPGGADDIKISDAKAKSGSNSLYFTSTISAGGPVDVVLPFGSNYSTGTFNISMWMFVDNFKKGYFNLQEQTLLGKGWSIDVNFDSIGKFKLVNTTSGTLLTGSYTQNAWMKVEFNIDLSTNTWDFKIDGVSKGVFQNSYRQVAAMDFYPTKGSSYYVDDVSYTYTPYILPVLNAALTFIDKVTGKLATQVITPSVEIRNLGTTAITSATVELTYNGSTQTKTLTGINIGSLSTYTIVMNNPVTLIGGSNNILANVTTVNGGADNNLADNLKTLTLNTVSPAPGKMVVAEESTGTWCPWCPRGTVWLKNMDDKYNGLIMGIAVHNADPMTNQNYDKGLGSISSGYPSVVVDRGPDIDPQAIEADFLERILVPAAGNIRNGAVYNAGTKELKVSLTTKFNATVTGAYKIAFVLLEDSVSGSAQNFAQANNYAGGGQGVMGGFELLPNPVPASQIVYNHVGRIIYPNFKGLPNSFPLAINAGDSFTHNFSVILDQGYKMNNLHVGGLLINPAGRIDNGSKSSIVEATLNGFVSGTLVTGLQQEVHNTQFYVYPNPSSASFNIQIPETIKGAVSIQIFDMQGKLIHTEPISGTNTLFVNAITFTPGFYTGVIHHHNGSTQFKLIKE